MPRRKLPYKEGDWFAVPLRSEGYGLGLVARMNGKGIVLGYFFGPLHKQLPTEKDIVSLSPMDAVLVRQFGDSGFLGGKWPVIYRPDDGRWSREEWPLPAFGRIVPVPGSILAIRTEYSEDDINHVIREVPVSVEEARQLPRDVLSGDEAIEIIVTKLLSPTWIE